MARVEMRLGGRRKVKSTDNRTQQAGVHLGGGRGFRHPFTQCCPPRDGDILIIMSV